MFGANSHDWISKSNDTYTVESQKNKTTPIAAPSSTTTFKLGNFAKSLLAEAQNDSSDINLSPNSIQSFLNPLRSQLGLPNLRTEDVTPENNTTGRLGISKLQPDTPESNTNEILGVSKLNNSVDMASGEIAHIFNRQINCQTQSTNRRSSNTLPIPSFKSLQHAKENLASPDFNISGGLQAIKEESPETNTNELVVAYRYSGDLSSEIKRSTHDFVNNQESVSSGDNGNLNLNSKPEVAARVPSTPGGLHSLGERPMSGVVHRGIVPGQMGGAGNGTPVGPRNTTPHFRPPHPNTKGKNGNPPGKKNANTWKFKSEMVDHKEYLILRELGRGGCGQVDLVTEKETRELYALKKVNLAGVDESNIRECLNEIEMLFELKDTELVIRIFSWEVNHVEKTIKIVMEYGQCDLRTTMHSAKSTLIGLKCVWHRMLCIVATIHSRGIVHADLKPANFVWVGGNLKIIDFGIANRLQTDHTSISTLNPKGTMNFISPETLRADAYGRTKISPKSDIWSLGCILYMMIYGKTPFQDITYFATKMNAICTGAVNYPPIPEHLQRSSILDVLHECFKVDPKERPSASDLLNHPFLRNE